jgi:pimeloyl-ACP methyl ester carboxylesterase
MPTFSIPGPAGQLHVVDLREESPTPSGALPIVFVHGMVGHTGFWNAALAACADRRRAVAVDLRGHGNSKPPSNGDYSVAGCASDVFAVVDALALGPIVLVGHSYGALVTIEAAAQRPDVVRRLVLIDPPGDFTRLPDDARDTQLIPFMKSLEGDQWHSVVEGAFEQALVGSAVGAAASVRARLATMPRDAMLAMYRSMFAFGASATLERYLAAPGTSAHAILAPANAWPFSLHNLVPALSTTVVPNVAHWIMLDAPDRFVAALEHSISGT